MIDDDWPIESVSICFACAKHPELKLLVASDIADGVCGVCGPAQRRVFNPVRFREARDVVRALIRLMYDEQDYNGHWGGTSVNDILFVEENEIFEPSTSDALSDELVHRIEWDDDDSPDGPGISLYAGHDENYGRGLQFSIPNTAYGALKDVEHRLEVEYFHAVEAAMNALVVELEGEIEDFVPAGSLWYRTRVGVREDSRHFGDGKVTRIAIPFKGAEIGALQPARASASRVNRQGVSVLYVASDIDTALSEIRPHPAHLLSVGGFRPTRRLRVANFNVPIQRYSSSDERLDVFAKIYHIDSLLSAPIVPEDRHKYASTQLLADTLIRRGFDAVSYRSSVADGRNLCAFRPSDFAYDETTAAVTQVDRLRYVFSEVPMSIEARFTPTPDGG